MSQDAREQARHISEVTKAYAEGKEIQSKSKDTSSWRDLGGFAPSWDWISCDYRVKPEERKPLTGTLWKHPDGKSLHYHPDHHDLILAEKIGWKLVTVAEVLPETETE